MTSTAAGQGAHGRRRPADARAPARAPRALRRADEIVLAVTDNAADDAARRARPPAGPALASAAARTTCSARYVGAAREVGADLVVPRHLRLPADRPGRGRRRDRRARGAARDAATTPPTASSRTCRAGSTPRRCGATRWSAPTGSATSRPAREHVTWFCYAERPDLFALHSVPEAGRRARPALDRRHARRPGDGAAPLRRPRAGRAPRAARRVLAHVRRHPEIAAINAHVEQKDADGVTGAAPGPRATRRRPSGIGHAMRCLALAQAFADERGGRARFLMADPPAAFVARAGRDGAPWTRSRWRHARQRRGRRRDDARAGAPGRGAAGSCSTATTSTAPTSARSSTGGAAACWRSTTTATPTATTPTSCSTRTSAPTAAPYARPRAAARGCCSGPRYALLRREFRDAGTRRRAPAPRARAPRAGDARRQRPGRRVLARRGRARRTSPARSRSRVLVGGANPHRRRAGARGGRAAPHRVDAGRRRARHAARDGRGRTSRWPRAGGTARELARVGTPQVAIVARRQPAPGGRGARRARPRRRRSAGTPTLTARRHRRRARASWPTTRRAARSWPTAGARPVDGRGALRVLAAMDWRRSERGVTRVVVTGASGLLGRRRRCAGSPPRRRRGRRLVAHGRRARPTACRFRRARPARAGRGRGGAARGAAGPRRALRRAHRRRRAARRDPDAAPALNAEVPGRLARPPPRGSARAFVHVSTDAVYDGERPGAHAEDEPPRAGQRLRAHEARRARRRCSPPHPDALVLRTTMHGWTARGRLSFSEAILRGLLRGRAR